MAKSAREQVGVDLPEPTFPQQVGVPDQEEDRPGWLPEQFESPEALAKSYSDLRVELQQRGEKEKLLEQKLDSLETLIETMGTRDKPEPQQQGFGQDTGFNEQLQAAYETDPIGTMVFLAQQVSQNTVNSVLQQQQPQNAVQAQLQGEMVGAMAERTLEEKYDDWSDYGPKIAAAIEADPTLMPNSSLESVGAASKRLEAVYKQVKFDDLSARLANGDATPQDMTRMKQQAQTVTGGVGRPGEASDNDQKIERLIAAARNSSYSSWRGSA